MRMAYGKRLAAATLAICVTLTAGMAQAIEIKPFEADTFEAAKSAGKPVVVDVTASWCSTCKAQQRIIGDLAKKPEFADVLVLQVDVDTQKDAMRSLGAQNRSTLIAFNGANETKRTVGDTNPQSVEALFATTLTR
ncbi:MAG: thioredoxin family protein [Rhizobium sp.]|nr:thioredoxin family protein [Rhizobium sp.]